MLEVILAAAAAILAAVAAVVALRVLGEVRALRGQEGAEDERRRALEAQAGEVARLAAAVDTLSRQVAALSSAEQERFDGLVRDDVRLAGKMDDVRREVSQQLEAIRTDNQTQLERMRETVDEKLQTTLEARLARSFKQVSDQLEAVYKGLGDMQGLAQGVGDLKRVLTNVKTRGMLGEVQLGAILAEVLAPEQYAENVATKPGSAERVEFAVKLPVRGGDPIWLPIDAKFPGDTYRHLRDAQDTGDSEAIAAARRALEQRVRAEARDIQTKYLAPPATTSFAIMFLPFEGLYAEVVDMPGLLETLQRDHQVSVAGPSTMAAILSSLEMSYQTFAFQQRADEIQQVLAAVKAELPRYQAALKKAYDQISRAGATVESIMTTRTRAMERKLRQVTALEDAEQAERLLGVEVPVAADMDDEGDDA